MSSIVAPTGGAFLDALAQRRSGEAGPRVVATHWDSYQWGRGISRERSGEALRRLLAADLPQVVVASRDLRGMLAEALLAQESQTAQGHGGGKAARPWLSTIYVEPRDDREATLAGLWQELFGIAPIGADDSFFELGGHSLLATQLAVRVRDTFGVELPVRAIFQAATVAEQAELVARAGQGQESPRARPIRRVSRDGDLPLSFAQERLWFLDQLTPGSPAYNVPAALVLRGRLDVPALEWAFAEVVRRHETLRTTFPDRRGTPGATDRAPHRLDAAGRGPRGPAGRRGRGRPPRGGGGPAPLRPGARAGAAHPPAAAGA